MAILYGTQSNGETLPVLVDQFGNLLAKGIEGEPGTSGTPGKDGEQGPPGADGGSFALPPDPYEGAFLGWLNNGLAWIGTPPVPIPEGVFGPITGWDAAGLLTVEGDIPSQIAQGVFVYQCNQDGSIYVDGWNNSQVWSAGAVFSASNSFNDTTGKSAFDGSLDTLLNPRVDPGTCTITFTGLNDATAVDLYLGHASGVLANANISINGTPVAGLAHYAWATYSVSGLSTIEFGNDGAGNSTNLSAIRIGGRILVDQGEYPSAPNLNFRVQSVSGQNLIGVANRTDNFSIGKYLRVPQQNVARWLYDGALTKVITSTGIDFSRLTGT